MNFLNRNMPWSRLLSERGLTILLTAIFILIAAALPSFTTSLEKPFIRAAIGIPGGLAKAPEITIVAIDDRSVREIGPWPWRAKNVADLIEKLGEMNAKLVAIDPRVVRDAGLSDMSFSRRDLDQPAIVFAYEFYPTLADIPPVTDGESKKQPKGEVSGNLEAISFPSKPADDSTLIGMAGIDRNMPPNSLGDRVGEGFYNLFENSDKIVLDQPLAVRFRGRALPAFSVVTLSRWRGFTPILTEDAKGRTAGITIGNEYIRTDQDSRITIGFRGPAGTFPRIGASDILGDKTRPKDISDKIVLLGLVAEGTQGRHETIVGAMDDMEIQANILDNILHGRTIAPLTGRRIVILLLAALGIIIAFGIIRLPQTKRLIALALFLASLWISGFILFYAANIWFPVIQLSLVSMATASALAIRHIFAATLPRHHLTRQFGWRLPKGAIESLVIDRSPIEGHGHRCEITAMAIDIKGFGAIADKLPPGDIIKFVLEYRLLVTDIIMRHGGMIESWVGDDCRAAFGAPIPLTEHTLRACLAASDLRKKIKSAAGAWSDNFGIDKLNIGVGIQRGPATAGDFGLGYSLIGGAMEAALQLRTQNRFYRTWALVGNAVYEETKSAMEYRPLDPVHLWGSAGPTPIHELVGDAGTILPSLSGFQEARKAYLEGRFDLAIGLFEKVLSSHPNDGPSRLFLKRSIALKNRPPEVWNGVWKPNRAR